MENKVTGIDAETTTGKLLAAVEALQFENARLHQTVAALRLDIDEHEDEIKAINTSWQRDIDHLESELSWCEEQRAM